MYIFIFESITKYLRFFYKINILKNQGPPGQPVGPLVLSNFLSNGCTISWQPPKSDGGSRIISYIVEAREARRANWYQIEIVEPTEVTLKINGLIESNSYYFRVLAKNSIGLGPALETDTPVSIIRPPGIPDTPVPLLVSDIQSDNCTLEWNAPSWTGGEDLLGYSIEMRIGDTTATPGPRKWTKVNDSISPNLRTYQVKNLEEGKEYYFRISAFNKMGSSKPLELNRPVIPKKKLSAPMPPTGPITPLKCNKDSISIQWGPPKDDGGAPLTRYLIYYREVNKQNWVRSGVVDPQTCSYQCENLTENSEYHFRVFAENYIGQSKHLQTSEPIKARSPYNVPDKPEGPIVVTNVTASSATVSWKKPLNDGGSPITGYLVKRRDIERPVWVKCGRVSADTYRAAIRDLAEGCQYTVQIFAENTEGLSEPLELDEPIQPKKPLGPPQPPASFECIGVDTDSVTLQWESPLDDGGSQVRSYKLEICEKGRRANIDTRAWTVLSEDISSIDSSFCANRLKEGHEYLFRISALNEKGFSEPKVLEKSVTPRKLIRPPASPTGPIKILSMEENSVTVGWNHPKESDGSFVTNYVIEIRDVLKANWVTVGSVSSSATQYKINDLVEKNEYFIRIRSQNEANLSSQPLETDTSITVKSPYSVPEPPRELKLVSTDKEKVILQFKSSESDGGLSIKSYIIEKRDSNRVTWVKASRIKAHEEDDKNTVYTCELDDLNPGSSYFFRVFADNIKGKSEMCELSTVVRLEKEVEKPSKPLDLNVIKQKKSNAVMLDWRAPLYNGNDKINEFIIEKWSSETEEWSTLTTCDANVTQHVVHNLKEGFTYKFRIIAANTQGHSEPSLETVDVKIQQAATIPSAPSGPLKYTISEDQTVINLQWSQSKSDGGSKVKRYIIEKKQVASGMPTEWFKIGFTNPSETSFRVTEYFVEDSTFNFRVIAENEAGKSHPLELSTAIVLQKKKKIPEKASFLRVKEKTSSSVTLVWKSFATSLLTHADKFIIEKKEKNSENWTKVGQTKEETFTINDLDSNSSYYFRVIALNEAGNSEPVELQELVSMDISNELPSMPLSIGVDNITQESVTLSWICPRTSGAKPIIGYKIYKLSSINTYWQEVDSISKSKVLSCTVYDLDYNYDYKFKICAFTEIGIGRPNETEKVHLKKPIGNFIHFYFCDFITQLIPIYSFLSNTNRAG